MSNSPDAANPANRKSRSGFGEFVRTIFWALMVAVFIRIFLFQPFNIPSGSMIPTLLVGDYLFVSKYSYGYSKYSFPFSPDLFSGRIWAGEPERGDVAVFKTPSDNSTDYIKRIVGLPGDVVEMRRGLLYLNGKEVARESLGMVDAGALYDRPGRVELIRETFDTGSHMTLNMGFSIEDDFAPVTVPAGHYFVMGDNRDSSKDSRVSPLQGGVGFLPAENLVGRAEFIFLSTSGHVWEVWNWRWDRLFTAVR